MTRSDFTAWMQGAILETGDLEGPDYLGNIDDQVLIFVFPDGSRFGLAVLDESGLGKVHARLEAGKVPLVRVLDEDLEE